jgi:FkbM family methyltransferase
MRKSFLGKIVNVVQAKAKKFYFNPYAPYGISWFKLKILKHQGYNEPGEINIGSTKVKFNHPPELLHSVKEIFIDKVYEISTEENSPYIIDCGANIGLSVIYLKSRYPNSTIIAFEPDKNNFSLLQHNTQNLAGIQLENKAVWNADEKLIFTMDGTQSSSLIKGELPSLPSQEVSAIRLKNLIDREVFFLKMDIEGAEYRVIKDCRDVLGKVKFLFVEYHGTFSEQKQLLEIFQILSESGFKFYIKEADNVYPTPFAIKKNKVFDIQINIFAFR